ncbi:MAG: hypothetical protein ACI89L_002116 [Phycisphaerales bacterium]|jgi:hypothetical protein
MRFEVTGHIEGQEGQISTTIEADTRPEAWKKAMAMGYSMAAYMRELESPLPRPEGQAVTLDRYTLAEMEECLRRVFKPVIICAWVTIVFWIVGAIIILTNAR